VGDYALADQLAHRGLEVAADAEGSRICLTSLSLADNSRGAFADAVEQSLAASALVDRPTEAFGIAALAAIYGGDLRQARELNDRLETVAASPTLRALNSYVAAEIDTVARYPDHAESEYLCRNQSRPLVRGNVSRRRRVRRSAEVTHRRRSSPRRAARLSRRCRLLRSYRQLDPPVGDLS
jgi:hypothetical protein